jgi:predicted ArsR family transcriptional regulator
MAMRAHPLTSRQAASLLQPARLEALEAFQALGSATVAEASARLGRRPDALHYHVRALVRSGLLRALPRPADTGGRPATRYAVVGPGRFEYRLDPASAASRRLWTRASGAVLRAAERDVAAAVATGAARTAGPAPDTTTGRSKAWLDDADLRELARRIASVQSFLASRAAPGHGRLHSFTHSLAPIS